MTTPADDLGRRRSGDWPPRARRRPPRFPPEWQGDEAYPHVVDLRDELFRGPVPVQRRPPPDNGDTVEGAEYADEPGYGTAPWHPRTRRRADPAWADAYRSGAEPLYEAPVDPDPGPPAQRAYRRPDEPGHPDVAGVPRARHGYAYGPSADSGPYEQYGYERYRSGGYRSDGYQRGDGHGADLYLPAFPLAGPSAQVPAASVRPEPHDTGPVAGGVDGVAVAGFVAGVLGVTWPVGMVLSAFGIARTGPGRLPGRSLALAGLLAATGWLVVSIVVVAVMLLSAPRTATPDDPGAGWARSDAGSAGAALAAATRIGDLTAGTCFQDPASSGADVFDRVRVVPCSQSHDNEVVAVFDLADRPWPGEAAVRSEANDRCLTEGAAVLAAASVDPAPWAFYVYYPTRTGWDTAADRTVQCVAYSPAGPTTGPITG